MAINKQNAEKYNAAAARLREAAEGEDAGAFEQAYIEFAQLIEANVLAEAERLRDEQDVAVLAARGVRQLTAAENKYYNAVIGAMRSANPRNALENLDVVMPESIINEVFDDLKTEHPLLAEIDFHYGKGVTKWLMNAAETQLATWSALSAEIVKEITGGFKEMDVAQNKLSAFLPISKAMLDLGPAWLDRYVRAVLGEALAVGLEDGLINGRGQSNTLHEPIGMVRDLAAAVDQTNGYAKKTAVAVTALDAESFGTLLAGLAKDENGRPRKVDHLILVVNPVDYFKKIMPATTILTPVGTYANNVLPYPCKIIQSICVTEGEAVLGLGKKYCFVTGSGKEGIIAYSDEYRFLEDERVYLTKLYGHGQPKDNNAFMLLDISGLKPLAGKMQLVEESVTA